MTNLRTVALCIVGIGLAVNGYSQSFLTNGLVAYYPFNGNANDATGNGNDGTLSSVTPCPDRFGMSNSAFQFAGTLQSRITINSTNVLVQPPFTVSLWINYMGGTYNPRIFSSFGFNIETYGTNAPGPLNFDNNTSSGWVWCSTDNTFSPRIWQHVVAVRTTNTILLYLNGQQQGNVATVQGPVFYPSGFGTDWLPTLGCSATLTYDYDHFAGQIDDVRIYNRALSSNEVTQLYAFEQATNPPSITIQPQSVLVHAGDSTSFSVTATGPTPLNYQWTLNGTDIAGATSSTWTITNIAQSELGVYALVVTNAFGSVTSSNAILSMYPFIAIPFAGAVGYWGKQTTLSVDVEGTGPLTFQWFRNGIAVLNATNQTLDFPSLQFTNAGLYSVVITSPLGSVTNAPAQVVVNPAGVSIGMYPGVTVSGVVGYTYIIQATSDLTNTNSWTTVAELTLMQPVQLWMDINVNALSPANPHRYYRILPGG